ncbi:hypothetical protein XENTR_v10001039 [Xenopus tropicalis]|nr:protein FAM47E [Xenopus tropicalis]XP_012826763.1 protein FAM47E isoform X1 [Xenopus tropicalis]AAI55425.1 LOC100127812 protein [Xenopus tropicalis]KAE8630974.1 hypothetical protein XENTR_v10001039 [Xenopus tropicalis]|eukprot:XP_012826763.1 PREDICTED: protein FAM47E isoform X1 [Xenopus tropicalis]
MSASAECWSDSRPRHPWYKERLHKKFLKESNPKLNFSGAFNSHHWKFLPKGLDDFRDGYPPPSDTTHSQLPNCTGPAPILNSRLNDPALAEKKLKQRFTKEQTCFSKLLPLQQARREYIAEIEYGLTQHPLALYPHLEEGLPAELFEEVVEIIDPEMRIRSSAGSYEHVLEEQEDEGDTSRHEQQETQSAKSRDLSTRTSVMSEQSRSKNPYVWLSKDEDECVKEDKKSKIKRSLTPALDENVKSVAKEYCNWVVSLGGEQCNINESTIFSLFASGFDTKPALSIPIHVVELNNVPPELRVSAGATPTQSALGAQRRNRREQYQEPIYQPSWMKTKYGAWYLDPKTWKKQTINESLKDPKDEDINKNVHSKGSLNPKDEELLQLYGTAAFKDFLKNRGYRSPEFLNKLFPEEDTGGPVSVFSRESRAESTARSTWIRSTSASTHEESLIN